MPKNKVAVLYGAGGAVGGAVARTFAGQGARLSHRAPPGTGPGGRQGHFRRRIRRVAEVDALDVQAAGRAHAVGDRKGGPCRYISFNAVAIPNPRTQGEPLAGLDAGQFALTQAPHALLTSRGLL
jgi:hypothetical protein